MTGSLPACYHLDTSYLLAYLSPPDPSFPETRMASAVLGKLRADGYGLRVSEPALGEAVGQLVLKDLSAQAVSLLEVLAPKGLITVFRLERGRLGRFTDLVNRLKGGLRGRARRIDAADIVILALSMADRECVGLLTLDQQLMENRHILTVAAKHTRDRRRFTITNNPYGPRLRL